MLIESLCVLSIAVFLIIFFKERDWLYPVFFVFSFFVAAYVESGGVASNFWSYDNVIMPFGYIVFGIPVAILIIYGVAGSLVIYVTKLIEKVRENKNLDEKMAYISIFTGFFCIILSFFGMHLYIAYAFILFGIYLLVKDPTMFYIGTLGLVADLIIEHLFILMGQLTYTESYGDVGVAFFLVGSILSGVVLLLKRRK